jgi:hypothetical protein
MTSASASTSPYQTWAEMNLCSLQLHIFVRHPQCIPVWSWSVDSHLADVLMLTALTFRLQIQLIVFWPRLHIDWRRRMSVVGKAISIIMHEQGRYATGAHNLFKHVVREVYILRKDRWTNHKHANHSRVFSHRTPNPSWQASSGFSFLPAAPNLY